MASTFDDIIEKVEESNNLITNVSELTNEDLEDIIQNKKKLVVLTKIDLSDSTQTKYWIEKLSSRYEKVLALDLTKPSAEKEIAKAVYLLGEEKREKDKKKGMKPQAIRAMIIGIPNVGKSSLFNALLNLNRAIVTDIAGTTRDVIKENIDMGIPVTLIDTAGIRKNETVDKVEEIGMEYSKQSASEADLVLFMYDCAAGFTNEDKEIYEIIKNKNHITIANKIDLGAKDISESTIKLSTVSNEGLSELKDKIKSTVLDLSPEDMEFVTNKRQQTCLIRCKEALYRALNAAKIQELQDMIYIDLKEALLSLDEITGEVITDDILNNIFDHFCIGK